MQYIEACYLLLSGDTAMSNILKNCASDLDPSANQAAVYNDQFTRKKAESLKQTWKESHLA